MPLSSISKYAKLIFIATSLISAVQPSYAQALPNKALPGLVVDKSRPFNKYMWLTSEQPWDEGSQSSSLKVQLDEVGVRAFRLAVGQHSQNAIAVLLENIGRTLTAQKDAVVTIMIEGPIDRAKFLDAFAYTGSLKSRIFKPDRWTGRSEWPTLQEMIDADQRLILVAKDATLLNNSANDGLYVFNQNDIMVESDYTSSSDHRSCGARTGTPPVSSKTITLAGMNGWTRLFRMNHAHSGTSWSHAGDDNELGGSRGILPRVDDYCKPSSGGRDPNFLNVAFADNGDAMEYVEFKNNGGFIAHEGNGASQSLVCAVSLATKRSINLEDSDRKRLGCENDEMRSIELFNVKRGQAVEFYDNPDGSLSDDYAFIEIKKDISRKVIDTLEKNFEDGEVKISYVKKTCMGWGGTDCLDGKVSRIVVREPLKYELRIIK